MKLASLLVLAACAGQAVAPRARPTRVAAPPPDRSTRLVVLVVIDQWPEWAFETKRPELHGGFARLLSEGQWRVGRYPDAATLTGPDHALLGTGEPPSSSGIIADSWWHRDLHVLLESVHGADGAISSQWLRVPGLGDAIAAAGTGGEAVDIALKPRAAVLPLGHHGLSIWFDVAQRAWTSPSAPPWLAAYNRAHPIAARLHDVWTPLDPSRIAALAGVPDDQPGEVGAEGLGPTFPHDPQRVKDPVRALLAGPAGDELVLELATHAIEAEHLGRHHAPDLLVIGLSAHDFVGHGWGQESWEMWDLELRLDARLGQLLGDLDRMVGAGRWTMIVTGDHGASPLPERVGGGRITTEELRVAANNAASAVLGEGDWIDDAHFPSVYLSKAMLAQPRSELASAEKRVLEALRAFPGIEQVGRVADFTGRCDARKGEARELCLTFDRERSGELFYLPAPGWILEDKAWPAATAHGSLHDYDLLVPVILLPPRRTRHAPASAPEPGELPMTDIAPTLARWLGVPAPAAVR